MSSMNERITKHFGSITDHRLVQMKALAEDIPPKCGNDKELMYKWLTYSGRTRGYESLGCCHADGTFEMIYGEAAEFSNATTFLKTLENGENRIAVGYNSAGKQIILICVPVSIDIPGMEDCIALVGELPISYIADTLGLVLYMGESDNGVCMSNDGTKILYCRLSSLLRIGETTCCTSRKSKVTP